MSVSPGICLVTGANRGIGREVCRQLAERGATVLLTARDLAAAQATATELDHSNLVPVELDVTDPESIAAARALVDRRFGRLDALINNAAILYDPHQKAISVDLTIVHQAMATNLYGPWRLVQAFLPLMRRSPHPRIVNVSSGSGALNDMGGGTPAYGVSKAALNALTLKLAAELRGDGMLVNAVCPGWVATDMGGPGGRPVADGARGIVWAATLPANGPTGGFFRDRRPIPW